MSTFALGSRRGRRGLHSSLLGLTIAAGVAIGAQAGSAAQPRIGVTIDDGRLTLSAPGAKLDSMLRAIGAKAGFKVIIKGNLPTPTHDAAITGVPLARAIQRLAGDASMVIVYEPDRDESGHRRISELRVYGPSGTPATQAR